MILNKKKLLFLSGTRADFGKLKSLMRICENTEMYEVHIFATGMHMHHQYGYTVNEIEKSGFKNIYKFINYTSESSMDLTMAKTIDGLSSYIREEKPDLIVVHGDRAEALAGAIVGALNNILVAHIEGGEVSGTIDELIRHSVSKMSHIHFVSNESAKRRLIQMGECEDFIFIIGSPDIDVMFSHDLPTLGEVKKYYDITFEEYGIVMFHPVTTEEHLMMEASIQLVEALIQSDKNYVIIFPNNDLGSRHIIYAYEKLKNNDKFKIFPSVRFEYFLVLLKNSLFLLGNSSAGIREAPHYGIPSVNIGTRQLNRALNAEIVNTSYDTTDILHGIQMALDNGPYEGKHLFGMGESDQLFLRALNAPQFWKIPKQKVFKDIAHDE
jgi:UDP-N-acetylglucosamine 2-epimerase (hydrolysing)